MSNVLNDAYGDRHFGRHSDELQYYSTEELKEEVDELSDGRMLDELNCERLHDLKEELSKRGWNEPVD